ncbi:MAG: prolyl oligopeptidase family serine peptidase [Candidatus Aminicenantes bacterium]|nr:prolyl oligopeptidase family serine peptidase [Candidatus Aminicenantes bacterium]
MSFFPRFNIRTVCFFIFILFLCAAWGQPQAQRTLTLEDIMRFQEIRNPVISEDGLIIAYATQPGRGDGGANIHNIKSGKTLFVERGSRPIITKNSLWVVLTVLPKSVDAANAKKEKPKQGMALVNTQTGEIDLFENVDSFELSEDSKWLGYKLYPDETASEEESAEKTGATLVLRNLETDQSLEIPHVLIFAFDKASKFIAFARAAVDGSEGGLNYRELNKEGESQGTILKEANAEFSNLVWTDKDSRLAFLFKSRDSEGAVWVSLKIWDGSNKNLIEAVASNAAPEGWILPENNRLSWTPDGSRLFFGFKPEQYREETSKDEEPASVQEADLFDTEKILADRGVDIWHWNDPLIIPNQKVQWSRKKNQTYLAVFDMSDQKFVQLADEEIPEVRIADNPNIVLGISNVPYQKEITWVGDLQDIYTIRIKNGEKHKVVSRLEDQSALSPDGCFVIYFKDKHWFLYTIESQTTLNLTEKLDIPFYDEDNDTPQNASSYGISGWTKEDKSVLLYDKYDIWQFSTEDGQAVNITGGQGRKNHLTFRVLQLDPDKRFFEDNQRLYLSSYNNLEKNFGFYTCRLGRSSMEKLLEENKRFLFLSKAKNADVLMYTREDFEEFPDIWTNNLEFTAPRKISEVNPQIREFFWGKAELVEWSSADGIPLQGVLIKPANYEPGKRYPVIVYYYRFFSQRLYEFNQMAVNHRPNFPFYTSNGYAVFLPDIHFEIGTPGFSATKSLVPGVQKLIDMGVADPKGIGLHGHSWSGYQTAFVITQTNMFSCAIAGAPVSNMTSAYSGIRWESGLARQMQYEMQQSRIGGSLWEYPERYIENSPVFFADHIETPLLIQFGDEDGAVPWYQGIELYLAMRRLQKDCVFLQYRGEPHHLGKYANKLDYSIKMKEYFDYYLKGSPAPDWIIKGVPYRGK